MNTVVDVLPEDCVRVNMDGVDWGVLYDKAKDGSVFVSGQNAPSKVADGEPRVLVPLYPVSSETIGCCSEVAKIAESEGLNLMICFSSDNGRIGCLAH